MKTYFPILLTFELLRIYLWYHDYYGTTEYYLSHTYICLFKYNIIDIKRRWWWWCGRINEFTSKNMANYSINLNPSSLLLCQKYQISWKIFFSDYHVFTSRFVRVNEGEGKWAKEEKKRQILCAIICASRMGGKEGGWVWWWEANEWERTTILNWKRGKLSLYIFLIFSDGLVCGEERENRLYIGSFVCRRTSSFFRESTRFSHPNALMCVCVCEWEKFIILKGGLVAKNMCICKAIFKRLLLFLGTVQCCWMSGAKGILQNDIYAFFFSLACICCCCSLKEVNEFYNLIKSSIHSIVIHICSCHNAHIIAVVVPHSKWNDFQNGFKLCTHINADDTLSSSLLLLFL